MNAVDWTRDICERCLRVIEMPDDGSESAHVCVHDYVPWRQLYQTGIRRRALRNIQAYAPRLGRVAVPAGPVTIWGLSIEHFDDIDSPDRMGPFEPATPPPPVLVSDLLLWTREDFLDVPGVGPRTVAAIERWMARHGFRLQERDHGALRIHLAGVAAWRRRRDMVFILASNAIYGKTGHGPSDHRIADVLVRKTELVRGAP